MIAALFVAPDGTYAGLPSIDLWEETRDARRYAGPWPVVAHPPCKRWGRMAAGGTAAPGSAIPGDDKGCFAAALGAVRKWGGVLEHPADSLAWKVFHLNRPPRSGGWVVADWEGGWTCYVEQGHYGHMGRKPTFLYAAHVDLPSLIWGRSPQRLDPAAVARHGYEKARRMGIMASIGGSRKTQIREATPPAFRDMLISIAHTALR